MFGLNYFLVCIHRVVWNVLKVWLEIQIARLTVELKFVVAVRQVETHGFFYSMYTERESGITCIVYVLK